MSPREIKIDFTGVESGGGKAAHVPEGDYALKLSKVVKKTGENSGKDYLSCIFKITRSTTGKGVGQTVWHNFTLQKQGLWNFRNYIEAVGKQVPSKAIKIDLDGMKDWPEVGATLVDGEPYEDKVKSEIASFFPTSELGPTKTTAKSPTNGKASKVETKAAETEETEETDEAAETEETEETEEGGEEEELFS